MIAKSEFRKRAITTRESLTSHEVEEKSDKIFGTLVSMDEFKKASSIMLYMDFKNEVRTDKILSHVLSKGKNAIIPVTVFDGRKLIPSVVKSPESELSVSACGIREPIEEFIRPFDRELIDIVIVPGVAFDESGYRMGYGAGFYDRFLSSIENKKLIRIGVAFESQVFRSIPHKEHDAAMDYIITEDRIIKTAREF